MPKARKIVGIILVGAIVAFALLLVFVRVKSLGRSVVIYSDSRISKSGIRERNDIMHRIQNIMEINLPENSQDLYFSWRGSFLPDFFAAFRLPGKDECEAFFEKEVVALDKFQEGSFSSEGPWDRFFAPPPHTWGKKYQDSNWRLSNESRFVYIAGSGRLIIYVPDENRIYLYADGGP